MATKESKRVMKLREKSYTQVNFLAPHGTKILLRAMAQKEKCTASDVIRRAILARAGLEEMPDAVNLAKLLSSETSHEAADALIDCQAVEHVKRQSPAQIQVIKQTKPEEKATVVMLSSKWYKDESLAALRNVQKAVTQQNTMQKPRPFTLSRRDYIALCRLLSNADIVDNDNM